MGNAPNTDILCSNEKGTKFVHIQVKTFRPNDRTCSVGKKAERYYGDDFFWVLGGIPEPYPEDKEQTFKYFIIPSKEMSRNVQEIFEIWVNTPGMKGQKHDKETKIRALRLPSGSNLNGWDISPYLNRWDLIQDKLK